MAIFFELALTTRGDTHLGGIVMGESAFVTIAIGLSTGDAVVAIQKLSSGLAGADAVFAVFVLLKPKVFAEFALVISHVLLAATWTSCDAFFLPEDLRLNTVLVTFVER